MRAIGSEPLSPLRGSHVLITSLPNVPLRSTLGYMLTARSAGSLTVIFFVELDV